MSKKALTPNRRYRPTDGEIFEKTKERGLCSSAIVLFYLRSRMNTRNHFVCWPTPGEIAEGTGITERQARQSLKELRAAGLIRIQKRNEGSRFSPSPYKYSFVRWWANEEIKPRVPKEK